MLFETDFPHPTSMAPGPQSVADHPRDYAKISEHIVIIDAQGADTLLLAGRMNAHQGLVHPLGPHLHFQCALPVGCDDFHAQRPVRGLAAKQLVDMLDDGVQVLSCGGSRCERQNRNQHQGRAIFPHDRFSLPNPLRELPFSQVIC